MLQNRLEIKVRAAPLPWSTFWSILPHDDVNIGESIPNLQIVSSDLTPNVFSFMAVAEEDNNTTGTNWGLLCDSASDVSKPTEKTI